MYSEFAEKLQGALKDLLLYDQPYFLPAYTGEETDPEVQSVSTYKDGGVMTLDHGLVVRFEDGTEVQLTIRARNRPIREE